jgi:ankyrin repeat protein
MKNKYYIRVKIIKLKLNSMPFFNVSILLFTLFIIAGCNLMSNEQNTQKNSTQSKNTCKKLKQAVDSKHLTRYLALLMAHPNLLKNEGASLYWEPLHYNLFDFVSTLVSLKVDVDGKVNRQEERPIHIAANYSNKYIIQLLLDNGADVKLKDKYGNLPIYFASKRGDLYFVKFFQKLGNPLSGVNKNGENLLHAVAKSCTSDKDCADLIKYLIDHGVNINKINKKGKTPLHLATPISLYTMGRPIVALLQHGANPKIKDNDGNTPLDLALSTPYREKRVLDALKNVQKK